MRRYWSLVSVLILALGPIGCSSPGEGVDARALTFMERRAQQIDQNRDELDRMAAQLEAVSRRTRKLESAFAGVKQGLDRSKYDMDEQLSEMVRIKDELELSRAQLASTSDAVKELHAWTQGILKNRSELETMQDRTGQTEERLDALSKSVESLRATSSAVVETKNALESLNEKVSENLARVEMLSDATESVLSKKIDFNFTAHEESMKEVAAKTNDLETQYDDLKKEYAALAEAHQASMAKSDDLLETIDGLKKSYQALESVAKSSEGGQASLELASELQELRALVEAKPSGSEPSDDVEDMRSLIKVLDKRLKALESSADDSGS